jgi:two-component system phosphate regulon sensor histidine kinase PhoR
VSPTSRRIFRYWLLLLVPTLLVGGGAIALLRREQGRLAEQSAEAAEARRAAMTARTRLIAENVELLVGDVEDGLLEALGGAPEAGLNEFLVDWEAGNPLVRTAFLATREGRLLRPQPNTTDDDARGFVRRFQRLIESNLPWQAPAEEKLAALSDQKKTDELEARKEVAANVAQVQSARRDVQDLLKAYPTAPSASQALEPAAGAAVADMAASNERSRPEIKMEADRRPALASADRAPRQAAPSPQQGATRATATPLAAAAFSRAKDAATARHGWTALSLEGRQHVFGWFQPEPRANVRGVELELVGLLSRLGGALPQEVGAGEGYALHDEHARVVHQVGAVPQNALPVVRLPLSSTLLPGWEVVAFLTTRPEQSVGGLSFFWVGVLLVGIFVVAIVAGGSLLVRQARQSEDEAAQKTSFVANVSHEFKTPLTTIRLYSELLEQGRVRDAEQGHDYLRTIGRETQRLARLVNNALDFSRLEQGHKKYAREAIELTAELGRLLDTHAPRVAEAGMALHRDFPDSPVEVVTDRDAIEQIVLNLIDNACKYAAAGGEVVVAVRHPAGGPVEVRVADRGPGVPLEHRERIFEKFHRVDDALTAEKGGAGLGLSIARQLARGLGGELSFVPREGGGAEFVVTLP